MKGLGLCIALTWSGAVWAQDTNMEETDPNEAEPGSVDPGEVSPEQKEASPGPVDASPTEAAPSADEMAEVLMKPDVSGASDSATIRVTVNGEILLDGEKLSKRKLATAITEKRQSEPDQSWRLELESGADQSVSGSVVGALFSAGVRDFEEIEVSPPESNLDAVTEAPIRVGGPVAFVGAVVPAGELRMGLGIDRLDHLQGNDTHLDPGLGFDIHRAALGVDLNFGQTISGRALVQMSSMAGTESLTLDTVGGDSATLEHPLGATGYEVMAQEVYVDLRPLSDERLTIRTGAQESVFGAVGRMDDLSGFYTMGPNHQSMAVIAGLVDLFDVGVSVHAQLLDGQGQFVFQAVNSAENRSLGESDTNKALVARAGWAVSDHISVALSGLQEEPDDEANASVGAGSVMAEFDSERVGFLAEFLWGTWDVNPNDNRTDRLIGGQAAARGDVPVGNGAVHTVRTVAKAAYFDPRSETQDADANFHLNLSVQGLWSNTAALVSTGVGYEVLMPMNITAAIEHRALFQVATEF